MEKKIEAIDKIVKRMVEISDSRLCKQLNANWVMLRNSLLTPSADVQERAKVNTNRGHSTNDNVRESKVPESDAAHLAGASSVSGMQWVKACDRIPLIWSSDEQHYKLDGRMVSACFYKNKHGALFFQYYDSLEKDYRTLDINDFGRIQWLDESGASSLQAENERLVLKIQQLENEKGKK